MIVLEFLLTIIGLKMTPVTHPRVHFPPDPQLEHGASAVGHPGHPGGTEGILKNPKVVIPQGAYVPLKPESTFTQIGPTTVPKTQDVKSFFEKITSYLSRPFRYLKELFIDFFFPNKDKKALIQGIKLWKKLPSNMHTHLNFNLKALQKTYIDNTSAQDALKAYPKFMQLLEGQKAHQTAFKARFDILFLEKHNYHPTI